MTLKMLPGNKRRDKIIITEVKRKRKERYYKKYKQRKFSELEGERGDMRGAGLRC